LKNFQDIYEGRVAELGEESEHTIRAGEGYSINLQNANRWGEARELLTKLLATSKQVFGADHNITKSVEAAAKRNHLYTDMIMAALRKKHGKDFFAE
jgi:predicted nucleic acid-binding protein